MLRNMDENKANMTRTLASIAALEEDLDRVRPDFYNFYLQYKPISCYWLLPTLPANIRKVEVF